MTDPICSFGLSAIYETYLGFHEGLYFRLVFVMARLLRQLLQSGHCQDEGCCLSTQLESLALMDLPCSPLSYPWRLAGNIFFVTSLPKCVSEHTHTRTHAHTPTAYFLPGAANIVDPVFPAIPKPYSLTHWHHPQSSQQPGEADTTMPDFPSMELTLSKNKFCFYP